MDPVLGVVVALRTEARSLLGRFGWRRVGGFRARRVLLPDGTGLIGARSGVGAEKAMSAARWLIAEGATALVVVGVSGGLDPALKSGDLVVAGTVLECGGSDAKGSWETDAAGSEFLYEALAAEGIPVISGPVVAAPLAALTAERKRSLHRESGALAVDMESAAVARAAAEGRLPLVVLRAVCDAADRSIPPDLFDCLDGRGGVRPGVLLRRIARKPSLAFELWRIGKAFSAAISSLKLAWAAQSRANVLSRFASGGIGPQDPSPTHGRKRT